MIKFNRLKSMIAISAVPATVAASLSVYALIENNNQGEAFNTVTGDVEYIYLLTTFLIGFIVIFVPVFLILAFGRLISLLFNLIFPEDTPKE